MKGFLWFLRMRGGWGETFLRRFPAAFAAALATLVLRMEDACTPPMESGPPGNLGAWAENATWWLALAVLANAAWTLWIERRAGGRGWHRWTGMLLLAGAFACGVAWGPKPGFVAWLLPLSFDVSYWGAAGCALVLAASLLGGGGDFRRGVWRVVAWGMRTLLVWGVLAAGLAAAGASVDELFLHGGLRLAGSNAGGIRAESLVWAFSWMPLLACVAIAQAPRGDAAGEGDANPKWGAALAGWVLLPLALLYAAAAAGFLAGAALCWKWPEKSFLSRSAVWFCLAGWTVWALLRGERGECSRRRDRVFCAAFPAVAAVFALVMLAAVVLRIRAYGMTPSRAAGLWLGAWTLLAAPWPLVRRRVGTTRMALAAAAAASLATWAGGPLSIAALSVRDQRTRLLDAMSPALERYDGSTPVSVSTAEFRRAREAARALAGWDRKTIPHEIAEAWARGKPDGDKGFWNVAYWNWPLDHLEEMMAPAGDRPGHRRAEYSRQTRSLSLEGCSRIWFDNEDPRNRKPEVSLPWTWSARKGFLSADAQTPIAKEEWEAFWRGLPPVLPKPEPTHCTQEQMTCTFACGGRTYRAVFAWLRFDEHGHPEDGRLQAVLEFP